MSKSAYEIRLDVLKMAKDLLTVEYAAKTTLENKIADSLLTTAPTNEEITRLTASLQSVTSNTIGIEQINKKARELYDFVENKNRIIK